MAKEKDNTAPVEAENTTEVVDTAKKKYIYIGPNIVKGLIRTGQVVFNFEERLKTHFEKVPVLKELFIPLDEYPSKREEIEKVDSIYSTYYEEVINSGI